MWDLFSLLVAPSQCNQRIVGVVCVSHCIFVVVYLYLRTWANERNNADRRKETYGWIERRTPRAEHSLYVYGLRFSSVQSASICSGLLPRDCFHNRKNKRIKIQQRQHFCDTNPNTFFLLDSISLRNTTKKKQNNIHKICQIISKQRNNQIYNNNKKKKKDPRKFDVFFGWKHKNKNKFSRVFECSNKTKLPFPITITFTFTFTFTLYIVQYPHPSYFFPAKVNRIWLTVVLGRKAKKKKTTTKYKKFQPSKVAFIWKC